MVMYCYPPSHTASFDVQVYSHALAFPPWAAQAAPAMDPYQGSGDSRVNPKDFQAVRRSLLNRAVVAGPPFLPKLMTGVSALLAAKAQERSQDRALLRELLSAVHRVDARFSAFLVPAQPKRTGSWITCCGRGRPPKTHMPQTLAAPGDDPLHAPLMVQPAEDDSTPTRDNYARVEAALCEVESWFEGLALEHGRAAKREGRAGAECRAEWAVARQGFADSTNAAADVFAQVSSLRADLLAFEQSRPDRTEWLEGALHWMGNAVQNLQDTVVTHMQLAAQAPGQAGAGPIAPAAPQAAVDVQEMVPPHQQWPPEVKAANKQIIVNRKAAKEQGQIDIRTAEVTEILIENFIYVLSPAAIRAAFIQRNAVILGQQVGEGAVPDAGLAGGLPVVGLEDVALGDGPEGAVPGAGLGGVVVGDGLMGVGLGAGLQAPLAGQLQPVQVADEVLEHAGGGRLSRQEQDDVAVRVKGTRLC